MSLFKANYGREPRMGFDIRKKGKNEKVEEFARKMKERHEEARAALVRSQEEMKRQADRSRKEAECCSLETLELVLRLNLILG